LVGLVPMLINVALAGLSNVVSGEIIQPVFISDPGRKIAFSTLSGYEQLLFLLCLITAVGLTFRGAMAFARQRERSSAYLLVIGAFELGILPEAFERTDLSHLALVSCFIVPTLLLILFPRTTWSWRGLWQTIGLGAVTALILVAAWPSFGNVYQGAVSAWTSFPTYDVTNDGRTVPVASRPEQELLQRLLRTVDSHSRAGQKVFIGPADLRTANYNDTFLYFLLPKLTPGTFYLEMDPGVANAKNSHLAHDISQDHIVILDYFDNVVARDADPRTRYGPNLPNSIVHTKFSRVGTFGPWSLYLRR